MSLRTRVLGLVEVVLRVPPLFIVDEILKVGFGVGELGDGEYVEVHGYDPAEQVAAAANVATTAIPSSPSQPSAAADNFNYMGALMQYDSRMYTFVLVSLMRVLLSTLGCFAAFCLFMLNTKHLMVVYMYVMSLAIVLLSYWTNAGTMNAVLAALDAGTVHSSIIGEVVALGYASDHLHADVRACIFSIGQNALLQLAAMFLFFNVQLGPRNVALQRWLLASFVGPSLLALLPMPHFIHANAAFLGALLPFLMVIYVWGTSILPIMRSAVQSFQNGRMYISNFGMSSLIENEWMRLSVPEVLRTFWLLRVLEHTGLFIIAGLWTVDDSGITPAFKWMKNTMITGCDTLIAVLGITSVVSYLCNHIGKFFQWILLAQDENDKGIGAVSAILFYILALQTGLTGLEPEKRFVRLCRNFCLLFTALLHFIHNIVSPLLMSLSASHNPSLKRHVRALGVCACLVLCSIALMTYLWANHRVSTWLLAVSAFSIEVIVKIAVSLCIYAIFLLDARRDTFWERLDDYVYYIRAFGNTVEFCFGIFLFFNGAWILVFESGGAIRAVMMCIHAYFNIWCDAKAGWRVFMKRRTAVNKIDSLPEADEAQLEALDDVCAICYQEMKSAKITRCKHFFHGVCLRKWLYVQDRCPLCHEILHSVEYDAKSDSDGEQMAGAAGAVAAAGVQHPMPDEEIFDDYR